MLMAASAGAAAAPSFERVFSEVGEPAALHYVARYAAQGSVHRVEVWRDGARLKRSTDDRLETYVERGADGVDFRMVVLDLERRISTSVDRTSLYRIGRFSDWFDLAHGLRHPAGDYTLARSSANPVDSLRPIGACDWWTLTEAGRTTQVCWSRAERLPLMMLDGQGREVWRITQVDRRRAAAATFVPSDADFVHHDVTAELERD